MAVDFRDPAHARSYSGREADASWRTAFLGAADPTGRRCIDLGCGGGTYSAALLTLGAASVVGVDSSAPILAQARADVGPGFAAVRADVTATGLAAGCADVVLSRAVVHHLGDLDRFAAEAHRLLAPDGTLVVQDRTPDDVRRPGGPDDLRGLLLELAPRLLDVELRRRPTSADATHALRRNGFGPVRTTALVEVRRRYPDAEAYLTELRTRTGRSILHELDDTELDAVVGAMRERLPAGPLVEQDRWTLWAAQS